MSFLFNRRTETRSLSYSDVWGRGTKNADQVAGDFVLRVIPVYSAVSLIADLLATLPLQQYRGTGSARERVDLSPFLNDPDLGMTIVDWIHQLMASLLLRGNAYGMVTRGAADAVTNVRWLNPARVSVPEFGDFKVDSLNFPDHAVYHLAGGFPVLDIAHGGPILHIRSFRQPAKWKGVSPIAMFQQQFEMWNLASEYGREWFEESGVPTGILKNANSTLDRAQTIVAKESFQAALREPGPVALDKNWDWQQVSLNPDEAQFLNTIKATSTQIAAIYRVDPDDIGGESNSTRKYSNREQDQVRFNVRTLLPWTVRIEAALKPLLPPGNYLKFNLDALARPDLVARVTANQTQLESGQLTLAEVRADEDRPQLSEAEVEFWQKNYSITKRETVTGNNPAVLTKGP
jgi:HK97 family phage portal protein